MAWGPIVMVEQEEINAVSAPGKARVDLVRWLATVMPYLTTSKNIFNALSMSLSICRTTSLGSTYPSQDQYQAQKARADLVSDPGIQDRPGARVMLCLTQLSTCHYM